MEHNPMQPKDTQPKATQQAPLTALELEQLLDQAQIIALDGTSVENSAFNQQERYLVLERPPYRMLVLNGSVQSVQNTEAPHQLILAHQMPLLSFLEQIPADGKVLELGLGGGSALRYAREYYPNLEWVCIERSPIVISLYLDYFAPEFLVPQQRILCADAHDWLTQQRGTETFDLLLCDVYEKLDEAFITACTEAVKPGGYLAINWLPHLQDDSYGQEVIGQCFALQGWPYEKEKITGFRNRIYLFQRPLAPEEPNG